MKQGLGIVALAASACATLSPAAAQERPHLSYIAGSAALAERGTAIMAAVRIPLNPKRTARTVDNKLRFDLVVGPSFRVADGRQAHRSEVINLDGIGFSLTPGHSTRLSLNGRPLVTQYADSKIAAAEGEKNDGGISTFGWVAIAGGVVLAGLGAAYLAFEDAVDCRENGQNVCE